jgi:hypothetical protein
MRRWEDNININLREVECDSVEWKQMARDRSHWKTDLNTAMSLRVPLKQEFSRLSDCHLFKEDPAQ